MPSRLIKDLPDDERPREKLERAGAQSLSDAEILALFIGTGRTGISSVDLGRELIDHFGSLKNLSRAGVGELCQIKGIGTAKSCQLAAVFEFGRRLAMETFRQRPVTCPEDVYELMHPEMAPLSQESVRALLLDRRKHLLQTLEIFRGTSDECFANPPDILRPAISHGAKSLVLVHNHPSGDPGPSRSDINATRSLLKACDAIGIVLDDHVIIGSVSSDFPGGYFSFRENGLL